MDTGQGPEKDSLTQTEVAISTSNGCTVKDLHNQMILNLSANISQENQSLTGDISTRQHETLGFPMWPLAVNTGTLANAECKEVYKHLVETVAESLTLIRELSPEAQIKGIKDIDGACSESLERIKVLNQEKGHGGEKFHTGNRAIRSRDMEIITSMRGSVGLIEIRNGIKTKNRGTGFRVGDRYLMSAYHVFEERIDYILDHIAIRIPDGRHYKDWIHHNFGDRATKIEKFVAIKEYFHGSPEKNLEKLVDDMRNVIDSETNFDEIQTKIKDKWCTDCVVKFFLKAGEDNLQATLSPFIRFADKHNDVIILELVTRGNTLPPPFLLDTGEPEADATVYGYLKENVTSTTDLFLDPNCQVYTSDDALTKDIEEAEQWWKSTLTEDLQNLDIHSEYSGCSPSRNRKHGNITMHTSKSFVHGTSGSPVITIGDVNGAIRPLVSAMYLRGYPSFYYNLQDSIQSHRPLPEEREQFNVFRRIVARNEMNENAGEINLKYFFEAGITMQKVKMLLEECHPNRNVSGLRQTMFRTTSTELVGMPDSTTTGGALCTKRPEQDAKYTGSLSNEVLRFVATEIPKEWNEVMISLGLPKKEIENVTKPYSVESAFTCLLKWRDMNAGSADVNLEQHLLNALKYHEKMDIIPFLASRLKRAGEQNSSSKTVPLKSFKQPVDQSKTTFQF